MSSNECVDPYAALPLNVTIYAGSCGVVTKPGANLTELSNAVKACGPPCTGLASFEPCVYISSGIGRMFDEADTTCGDTPSYHFDGVTGTAGWTRCLADSGLDVYGNGGGSASSVLDTFCVEDAGSTGLRVPQASGGLSRGAKIGVGVGVGVGGFLLVLSAALAVLFFVRLRRATRRMAEEEEKEEEEEGKVRQGKLGQ